MFLSKNLKLSKCRKPETKLKTEKTGPPVSERQKEKMREREDDAMTDFTPNSSDIFFKIIEMENI